VYANDNFSNWRSDFRQQVARCRAAKGAPGEIAALLAPKPKHYFILKPKHSAFLATPLGVLLAKLGVNRLVLAGMTADSCILATALDANAREFEVLLAREAVAAMPSRKRDAFDLLARTQAATVVSLGKDMSSLGRRLTVGD
jgi:nicotinamidase-related amidase